MVNVYLQACIGWRKFLCWFHEKDWIHDCLSQPAIGSDSHEMLQASECVWGIEGEEWWKLGLQVIANLVSVIFGLSYEQLKIPFVFLH